MKLTEPRALEDILVRIDERTPIGSALRSEGWARVPQGLRERAVFSASVESVRWLGRIQEGIREITARALKVNERGETYFAMDRSKLVAELRKLGRTEGIPHPDDPGRKAEGGRRKVYEADITDPISVRRLKLIVDTQMEMAYGYGEFLAAHDPAVLDVWPCWELIRVSPRAVPRDWRRRWMEAGGTLHDGRMIARKDSGIWSAISRFSNPYPPFDFNSGMGVQDVMRDEAEALGVIAPDETPTSQVQAFNAGLSASLRTRGMKPGLLSWLKKMLRGKVTVEDGAVRWIAEDEEPDDVPPLRNYNPHHDRMGRFAEASEYGGGGGGGGGGAAESAAVEAFHGVDSHGRASPLSSKIKAIDPEIHAQVAHALDAINQVHDEGGLITTPKFTKPEVQHAGELGGYVHNGLTTHHLELMHGKPDMEFTAVHEAGHWLDHQVLMSHEQSGHKESDPSGFASRSAKGETAGIMAALKKTEQVKKLDRELRYATSAHGKKMFGYLSDRREIFARAYSQYVAEKSNSSILKASLQRESMGQIGRLKQWTKEEFAPISAEFDKMFHSKGWQ